MLLPDTQIFSACVELSKLMNNNLILRITFSLSPSIIIELYDVREGLLVDVSGA